MNTYKKTITWPNVESYTDTLPFESYESLCMLAVATIKSLPSGCVVSYAGEDFEEFSFVTA